MKIHKKKFLPSILILITVLLIIPSYFSWHNHTKIQTKKSIENSSVSSKDTNNINKKENKLISEIILSSVGDCTIGHDNKFPFENSLPYQLKIHSGDYSYFFKNTIDIFKNDDLTTANSETTFTDSTKKANKQFTFKASLDYVKVLSLGGVEAVNISNNHIYDYLNKGFEDTKNTLKSENIGFFGENNIWTTEIKSLKLGFLGYTGFGYDNRFLKKIKDDIAVLKSQGRIVIINFHWGEEAKYYPNETQKYLAHFSIDNGADLIIGHHPHVIQGIENYNGRTICYSLGNFCFGGNMYPNDKDTFILQTKFKTEDDKLTSYGIRVIPCSISSVNYINDYCPTPLKDSKKEALLSKLNTLSPKSGFHITDEFTSFNITND